MKVKDRVRIALAPYGCLIIAAVVLAGFLLELLIFWMSHKLGIYLK